jgi:acetyl esterase/lipase
MRELKRAVWLACLVLLAGGRAGAEAPEYVRTSDVIYGRKHGMALTMDVFAPKKNSNHRGIVFVISGGWFSRNGFIHPNFFRSYLERGYTVFAVVHSSQPKFTIPEIIDDMHRAVRFIRSHAEDYHIDPNHIGVTGSSAGGHLALILGTDGQKGTSRTGDPVDRVSSKVQAVACFFPPSDFLNYGEKGRELNVTTMPAPFTAAVDFHEFNRSKALYQPIKDEKKVHDILKEISPMTHVSRGDAPTLILHGDRDRLVPLQQSEDFVARLKEVGVPARLVVKKDCGHGWVTITEDSKLCAEWFDKYLLGKEDKDSTADKEKANDKGKTAEKEKAIPGRSR